MSCLFSTPQQPPRQTHDTPRFHMTPEAVMAAALDGGSCSRPEDVHTSWLASSPPSNHYANGSDDEHGIVSPFHDIAFPKRELFDDFDLSRIPLSLFTSDSIPAPLDTSVPASTSATAATAVGVGTELGTAFTPESISPTTLTPVPSSSSSCDAGLHSQLGFNQANAFSQPPADFYSLHGCASPLVDTQGSHEHTQPAPLSSPIFNGARTNSQQSIRAPMNILSADERPLPSRTSSGSTSVSTESNRSQDFMTTPPPVRKLSLPQPLFQTSKHHSVTPRKRKSMGSAASSTSSRSSTSPPPPSTQSSGSGSGSSVSPSTSTVQPRKSTHNMIEKRYRTNINEKIAALRDAVPSLRLMVHRMEREGGASCAQGTFLNGGLQPLSAGESILMDDAELSSLEAEQNLLGGLAPAHKLNKATVLSKATEYISHLERSNVALTREVGLLRSRVSEVETILLNQQQQQQQQHEQHQQMQQQMAYGIGAW